MELLASNHREYYRLSGDKVTFFLVEGPLVGLRIVPGQVIQKSSSHALLETPKLPATFYKFLFWLN